MAYWALIAYGVSFAVIFVGRMILQYRRTGNTGFRGISGRPGSAEWLGGVLFLVALAAGVLAPVLQLAGHVAPFTALDEPPVWAAGFVLFGLGLAGTLIAQAAMGASWRIGVDASETTTLITSGPFALVRNPIFTAMLVALAGIVLLTPNALAFGAWAAMFAAIELQVRLVEEPYLLRQPGYPAYAARVGRFVPRLGRLR